MENKTLNKSDKSLMDAFEIEKKETKEEAVNDYDVFPDKVLLDKLRTKIIENIVDKEIPIGTTLEKFINEEIDKSIEGYDLNNLERSHIFNMIEDEINGNGPLTELLKDKDITEYEEAYAFEKKLILSRNNAFLLKK